MMTETKRANASFSFNGTTANQIKADMRSEMSQKNALQKRKDATG